MVCWGPAAPQGLRALLVSYTRAGAPWYSGNKIVVHKGTVKTSNWLVAPGSMTSPIDNLVFCTVWLMTVSVNACEAGLGWVVGESFKRQGT